MGFGRAKLTNPPTSAYVPFVQFAVFLFVGFFFLLASFLFLFFSSFSPSSLRTTTEWMVHFHSPASGRVDPLLFRVKRSSLEPPPLREANSFPRELRRRPRCRANSFHTRPRPNWLTENELLSRYSILRYKRFPFTFTLPSSAIFFSLSLSTSFRFFCFYAEEKRFDSSLTRTLEGNKIEDWRYFSRVFFFSFRSIISYPFGIHHVSSIVFH